MPRTKASKYTLESVPEELVIDENICCYPVISTHQYFVEQNDTVREIFTQYLEACDAIKQKITASSPSPIKFFPTTTPHKKGKRQKLKRKSSVLRRRRSSRALSIQLKKSVLEVDDDSDDASAKIPKIKLDTLHETEASEESKLRNSFGIKKDVKIQITNMEPVCDSPLRLVLSDSELDDSLNKSALPPNHASAIGKTPVNTEHRTDFNKVFRKSLCNDLKLPETLQASPIPANLSNVLNISGDSIDELVPNSATQMSSTVNTSSVCSSTAATVVLDDLDLDLDSTMVKTVVDVEKPTEVRRSARLQTKPALNTTDLLNPFSKHTRPEPASIEDVNQIKEDKKEEEINNDEKIAEQNLAVPKNPQKRKSTELDTDSADCENDSLDELKPQRRSTRSSKRFIGHNTRRSNTIRTGLRNLAKMKQALVDKNSSDEGETKSKRRPRIAKPVVRPNRPKPISKSVQSTRVKRVFEGTPQKSSKTRDSGAGIMLRPRQCPKTSFLRSTRESPSVSMSARRIPNSPYKFMSPQPYRKNTLQNLATVTSFIKRPVITPQLSQEEEKEIKKKMLEQKAAHDEEIRKQRALEKKKKIEEQKRKRSMLRKQAREKREMKAKENLRKNKNHLDDWSKRIQEAEQSSNQRKQEEEAKAAKLKLKMEKAEQKRREEEAEKQKQLLQQEEENKKRMEVLLLQKEEEQRKKEKAKEEARQQKLEAKRIRDQALLERKLQRQKLAEEKKLKKQEEAARLEEQRKQKEAQLKLEAEEKKRLEEEKKAEEERKIEEERMRQKILEEEEQRRIAQQKKQEELKRHEEQRKREERAKMMEEKRKREEERKRQELLLKQEKERQRQEEIRLMEKKRAEEMKKENIRVKRIEELRLEAEAKQREARLQQEAHNRERQLILEQQKIFKTPTPVAPPRALNTTYTYENHNNTTVGSPTSYDMTPRGPLKVYAPSTETNYNIDDLSSGDDTDDDENPRKKVPKWAKGGQFKQLIIEQYYRDIDLSEVFKDLPLEDIDLGSLFGQQKSRYNKRTSSAHWTHPILPLNHQL